MHIYIYIHMHMHIYIYIYSARARPSPRCDLNGVWKGLYNSYITQYIT